MAGKGCTVVPMEEQPKGSADLPPPYPGGPPLCPAVGPAPQYSPEGGSVSLVVVPAPPPKDYVLWSLFSALFCNFYCLGFAALTFSIKSRDRVVMGDMTAARRYGSTARRLNLSVIVVSIISIATIMWWQYSHRLYW